MTPLDLVALMQQRNIVMPDEFYSLDILQRQYAFTVSKLASVEQMRTVLNALAKSVRDGGTFSDFKKQISKDGIKLPEAYLDNVFRTNIQNAYSRGRWLEQQASKAERPYLMMMAIVDSRVRPSHLKLHRIVRHIDDPFWLTFYPPYAFRCRCYVIALTEKQAREIGITPDDKLPDVQRDAGWNWHPSQPPEQQIIDYAEQQLSEVAAEYPAARQSIEEIRRLIRQEGDAAQETIKRLGLTDATRQTLPQMIEDAVALDSTLDPSAVTMVNEYANGTGQQLDDYINSSKNTGVGNRVFDWLKRSYDSVANAAKQLKKKLSGNLDAPNYVFGKGQVIGINTPALFRQATAGQQVEIINARGLGIDLNKLGSDGVLLPPDLRLEVVDVKDGVVVMQPTTKAATQLFNANAGQLFAL